MGLSDRDYMRERDRARFDRERPFAPPPGGIGWPWMVLFWVVLAAVLFKIYGTYLPLKPRVQPKTVQGSAPIAPPLRRDERPSELPAPRAEQQQTARHVERPETSPPLVAREAPATGNTIYLCRAYSGGSFWANTHCNQHNALIERIAYVPAGLPFQQQVDVAREQQSQSQSLAAQGVTPTHHGDTSPSRPSQCKALEARVIELDAIARQPQSGQMQDWLAGQRRDARDAQFRLRC
jgi:hypothetical protein